MLDHGIRTFQGVTGFYKGWALSDEPQKGIALMHQAQKQVAFTAPTLPQVHPQYPIQPPSSPVIQRPIYDPIAFIRRR
jgi:hypothetical protein